MTVSMRDMLAAGVHFGHQTRFWNPKMATNGITDAKIVTKSEFDKRSNEPNLITRSKQHFEWPVSAGILMFDYDPDDADLEQDVVLKVLYTVLM